MTNDKLPEETTDKIKADAIAYMRSEIKGMTGDDDFSSYHLQYAYQAGATAWAPWKVKYDEVQKQFDELWKQTRELIKQHQRMADALETVLRNWDEAKLNAAKRDNIFYTDSADIAIAKERLQQFKDGGITNELASSLLNPPEDNAPNGMTLPATDPFNK